MSRNEKQHLIGGLLVLVFAACLWYLNLSLGWFLIVCGWAAAGAVEGYQYIRKEGNPSWYGAALSAAVPTIVGFTYEIWRYL